MSTLRAALRKRKNGAVAPEIPYDIENPMIVAEAPPPSAPSPREPVRPDPARPLRDVKPGEIGSTVAKDLPDEYSLENLRVCLSKTLKGSQFLMENLTTDTGYANLGYFNEVLDATMAMVILHMAQHEITKVAE